MLTFITAGHAQAGKAKLVPVSETQEFGRRNSAAFSKLLKSKERRRNSKGLETN